VPVNPRLVFQNGSHPRRAPGSAGRAWRAPGPAGRARPRWASCPAWRARPRRAPGSAGGAGRTPRSAGRARLRQLAAAAALADAAAALAFGARRVPEVALAVPRLLADRHFGILLPLRLSVDGGRGGRATACWRRHLGTTSSTADNLVPVLLGRPADTATVWDEHGQSQSSDKGSGTMSKHCWRSAERSMSAGAQSTPGRWRSSRLHAALAAVRPKRGRPRNPFAAKA